MPKVYKLLTIDVNVINMPVPPPGYLGWNLYINDVQRTYYLVPFGSSALGIAVLISLLLVPIIAGILAVIAFRLHFYAIMTNIRGKSQVERVTKSTISVHSSDSSSIKSRTSMLLNSVFQANTLVDLPGDKAIEAKTILIATLEYEIPDWKIKVYKYLS